MSRRTQQAAVEAAVDTIHANIARRLDRHCCALNSIADSLSGRGVCDLAEELRRETAQLRQLLD